MGTKIDPRRYNWYADAEPDEPVFALLARDKTAPLLIDIWAAIRHGRPDLAREHFEALMASPAVARFAVEPKSDAEIEARRAERELANEALLYVSAMTNWREKNWSEWSWPGFGRSP